MLAKWDKIMTKSKQQFFSVNKPPESQVKTLERDHFMSQEGTCEEEKTSYITDTQNVELQV